MAVLTACGSTTSRSVLTSSGSTAVNNSTTSTTTTSSPTGNIYDLPNAPFQTITISGTSGPYPTVAYNVSTSRTLKIKVTPLSAPNLTIPGYTNYVFPYGCAQLTVSVNGMTLQTEVLHVSTVNDSLCASAPSYQILDFSNAMTGNSAVTVSVTDAQYDNCRSYNPFAYGCSMSAVWSNHLVRATLQTQVDQTWMDP